jgi:hypothetical protein
MYMQSVNLRTLGKRLELDSSECHLHCYDLGTFEMFFWSTHRNVFLIKNNYFQHQVARELRYSKQEVIVVVVVVV